ncbi:MAG: NCS2 family nucleobase:cation symporter [Oscillospiraceae bacterium]|jgi:uracil permease|nr:NCS2 family nucleobase:cation symporter [Oscillospiraceae bacterium]
MNSQTEKLIYDVNERPPIPQSLILAIQHVFAMFGATVLVPILVNAAAGADVLTIPVALVTSGIGTLIYALCVKSKSPVYLGSSFAFIAPVAAGYLLDGKDGAFTGIMCVGIVYIIIAVVIRFAGKNWIDKILPPIIIGPMIMIIGLGLAPTAISSIGLTGGTTDLKTIIAAIVTFAVTIVAAIYAKGKARFLKIIPFLVGIAAGYIAAVIMGIVDFTPVKEAGWFSLPRFEFPFVTYSISGGALLTIVPVALVTICEHIGDHTALGQIIGKDLIKDPGLDRTLLGDGLATFAAGLLGGPANTTYGENTSVVGMTRVASSFVIKFAAIIAIIFGFLGKLTALISTIPSAVLGGVSILLYGFIAVNGLKVLVKNQVDFSKTKNIVVSCAMLVLGLGGSVITIATGNVALSISGMSLAAIIGIILNVALPDKDEQ